MSSSMKRPPALAELIPIVLHGREIYSADVKISSKKGKDKTMYSMILSWTEDEVSEPDSLNPSDMSAKCSTNTTEYKIVCDGPCRKKLFSRKIHTIGHCEHYLCDLCYKLKTNPDGTMPCTSFVCMRNNYYPNIKIIEAVKQYNRDIGALYKARKRAYKKGTFKAEITKSISNLPSNRSPNKPQFLDSREVINKFAAIPLTPADSASSRPSSRIATRILLFSKKNGVILRSALVKNFSQDTDLGTVITYAVRKISPEAPQSIRVSIGTSEKQAIFRPLDNDLMKNSLNYFTGANGKLNITIEINERLVL